MRLGSNGWKESYNRKTKIAPTHLNPLFHVIVVFVITRHLHINFLFQNSPATTLDTCWLVSIPGTHRTRKVFYLFTVMVEQQSLTEHLLAFNPDAIREATQHPFLKQAATGTLPSQSAISWLAQDRLYALSYVNFVSALLAKLQIPSCSNRTSTLQWRTADALIECLVNIKNELQLFEDVAKNQGWSHIFDVSRYVLESKSSPQINPR